MILFYLSEAFRSIKSAKTSFLLTTVSLTISVLLILISIITINISNHYSTVLKSNIKINVFLNDSMKKDQREKLFSEIENKDYSNKVEFISKDEAAEKFIRETGEDFRNILDYNPLPASFVVSVSENHAFNDSINFIVQDLSGLNGVDEVVFKEGFIYRLLNFIDTFKIYLFVLTALFSLIALYLVYATIRLIINSRMIAFETMKLVGAKLSTIKIPVLLNGLIAGIIAGILAFLISYFVYQYISIIDAFRNLLIKDYVEYLVIIFFTGPLLVTLVSLLTLRKVSLKI
jgi:cell division transport system permease protein